MHRPIIRAVYLFVALCALPLRAFGQAAEEEADVAACTTAELAADRASARTYILTPAQLKGLTEATMELTAAKAGPELRNSARQFYCRSDASDGASTDGLTTRGATRWFGKFPKVAAAYAGRGLTARDIGIWSYLAPYILIAASPEIAAMAPDAAAEARKELSAQQLAFVKQNLPGIKAWLQASSKPK